MEMPGFWDKPAQSAPILQKRRQLERRLAECKRLDDDASELTTWQELIAEGEADQEVERFAERLQKELGELELHLKLSGPDDDKNAILEIHSGAGGTESQDWADMLLRMYLRWAEAHGYESDLLDRQDGEEAGIKSATLTLRGAYGYGYLKAGPACIAWSASARSIRRRGGTSFASVDVYPRWTAPSRSRSSTRICASTSIARPAPAVST